VESHAVSPSRLKAIETGAERLGVELRMVPMRTREDFDDAFSTMTRQAVGGFSSWHRPSLLPSGGSGRVAVKYRLPACSHSKRMWSRAVS